MAGVVVGWLCFPDQLDTAARAGADDAGPVLRACVRRVQHAVLRRHYTLHADLVRRLPTCPELGTHVGECF